MPLVITAGKRSQTWRGNDEISAYGGSCGLRGDGSGFDCRRDPSLDIGRPELVGQRHARSRRAHDVLGGRGSAESAAELLGTDHLQRHDRRRPVLAELHHTGEFGGDTVEHRHGAGQCAGHRSQRGHRLQRGHVNHRRRDHDGQRRGHRDRHPHQLHGHDGVGRQRDHRRRRRPGERRVLLRRLELGREQVLPLRLQPHDPHVLGGRDRHAADRPVVRLRRHRLRRLG